MSEAWECEAAWIERVGHWVSLHPTTGSHAASQLADEVASELRGLDFVVELVRRGGRAPLLVARRAAPSGARTLGIYGHYDVEPARGRWRGDPRRLRIEAGRAHGRGIADNLGPLALRLLAARGVRRWPGVIWVLEGEEEIGSPLLAEHLSEIRKDEVLLWIDETGYFEAPSRQRILLSRWPAELDALFHLWRSLADRASVSVTTERRELRRATPASAGPVARLFGDRPYAAIGPNDEASNVHGSDESLPLSTLALSARQFVAMLEHLARGAST